MNIALFIRSLHKGGAEKQAILITSELKKKYGKVYLVVLYNEGGFIEYAKSKDIDIHFLSGSFIHKIIELYHFLKNNNITLLLNFLPVNNIIGIFVGRLARVKFCVGGIRGTKIKKNRFKMLLQKLLFNFLSNDVISNSYSAKRAYSDFGVNSSKIQVIHNFIEIISPPLKRNNDRKIKILSIGRFTEEKDYFTAINSFALLLKKHDLSDFQIEYNIIGYGNLKDEITIEIQKHKLENKIKIIQSSSDNQVHLKNSDIFLLTSVYEGMPNTIMEAMEFSLPIVSTIVGDSQYLVLDGQNGFLCPQKDTIKISESLFKLIVSKELRNEMGERSYDIISKKFNSSHINPKFSEFIQNLH